MAVTIGIYEPSIFLAGNEVEPDTASIPINAAVPANAGEQFIRGDFITAVSNAAERAVPNAGAPLTGSGNPITTGTGVIGLAVHDYNAVYVNNVGGVASTSFPGINAQPFGAEGGPIASGLFPTEPANAHYHAAHGSGPIGQPFEISLATAVGAYPAAGLIGSTGSIYMDATALKWVLDTTAGANKLGTIVYEANGPSYPGGKGGVGDTNKRVIFGFNSGVLF